MHKALYRIYRPTSFIDIVGQEQIISILKNQIKEGSVSHAYLFSGGRGTGKTSTAKVFAKAVNCIDPVDQEPCHKCSVCVQGDMDIIEIDAASNNSVDNIRELRENVVYTPSYGKYKVYIIDEVHMLSQGAFNALLKTLEEPPSHVIFILATTEPQKIPATVLSRCQRFDFKKIDKNQIIARMIKILDELGLTYEEEAIELIAQKSDGGMRDALSLLDQAIAYKELTYQNVVHVIGELDYREFHGFVKGIKEKTTVSLLENLQKIEAQGKDLKVFTRDFISYTRDMMVCKSGASQLLSHSGDEIEALEESAALVDMDFIINLIETLSDLEVKIKYATKPKILIEACFIRLTKLTQMTTSSNEGATLPQIEELSRKIDELELKISNLEKGVQKPKEKVIQYQEEKKAKAAMPYIDDVRLQANIDDSEKQKLEEVKARMTEVHEVLRKQKNVHLKALLMEGEPVRYVNDCIYIGYDDNFAFHKQTIETQINADHISQALTKVFDKPLKVAFIFKREMGNIKKDEIDEEKNIIEEIKQAFPDVPLEIRERED